MPITRIDHVNIDTCSVEETVAFWHGVLGLESRAKPSGNPGVWLYQGEDPLVHVNPVEPGPEGARPSTGNFNHVAFAADDFTALCETLDDASLEYTSSVQPEMARAQVFVHDPNGILVELTCPCP